MAVLSMYQRKNSGHACAVDDDNNDDGGGGGDSDVLTIIICNIVPSCLNNCNFEEVL